MASSLSSSIPLPASYDIAMRQAQSARSAQAQPVQGEPSDKVKKSAKEFEGMFMSEMLSHMFEGTEVNPVFGGGEGEKMFRSLLTQEYGKKMAEGDRSGMSKQIQTMMLNIQEQQQKG